MLLGLCACLAVGALQGTPVKVVIQPSASGYQLLRGGVPYFVKGAGGATDDVMLKRLISCGGNSVRTWGADNLEPLLTQADKLGITVTIGIWLGHVEHGFRWDDAKSVQDQYDKTIGFVKQYKNHPSLLAWALGNEMENGNNTPTLWKSIEALAKGVKAIDPNHPVMSVVAEISEEKIEFINHYAPSLDLLGINSYGGLPSLPTRLKANGFTRPYMVTEFGPLGPWEVGKTSFGSPMEQNSAEKAAWISNNYQKAILGDVGHCLGAYAFHWGNKQEETPTWFGLFLPTGEKTPSVDVLSKYWSGKDAPDPAPNLVSAKWEGTNVVLPGAPIHATVEANDPKGGTLRYSWEVRDDGQQRKKDGIGEATPDSKLQAHGDRFAASAPQEPGHYRLFLTVRNGKGGAITANFPFRVRLP